ncbi:MAG: DNA recombination protein RmuC [Alphaproteobacteria bacterium]|nr:DNA recombination protein RmuC [Alphaproteobacteria bacterium]
MTTYIFALLVIAVLLLLVLVFRKNTVDLSPLREDNTRLRERLAERLGMLSQNALELKNISADIANFKDILMGNKQARGTFGEKQLEDLVRDIVPPETYAFQKCIINGGATRLHYTPALSTG